MARRHLVAVMAVVLLLTATVQISASTKPDKLSIIVNVERAPMLQNMGRKFQEQYGIPVEIISQSYDTTLSKIISTFAIGAPADIIFVDQIWLAEFAAAKILVPLDEYYTSEMKRAFSGYMPVVTYEGKTYAVPGGVMEKRLFYNKKMLAKAGFNAPPTSWQELATMSRRMQDLGLAKYGIVFGWSQAEGLVCDYTAFLSAFGGTWKDAKGNWNFNQGGGLRALEFMVDSLKGSKVADPVSITQSDRTALNMLAAGDVPFATGWLFSWLLVNDPNQSRVAGDVGVAQVPGVVGITDGMTVSGTSAFGIMANTRSKEWAWKLMEFISSVEAQQMQTRLSNYPPARADAYTDDLVKSHQLLSAIDLKPSQVAYRPAIPWYTEFSRILQAEISNALVGKKSPKEALDDAVGAANVKSRAYGK
jgi:multiple sugar transport system substrate-binding protein